MAHYALLDENNIVTQVIVGMDENEIDTLPEGFSSWEEWYANFYNVVSCKRTSYNTFANQHKEGGVAFRGNYAQINGSYDPVNNVFIEPQPYPSWSISLETNWQWEAPVSKPDDGQDYIWNESSLSWELQTP